MKPEELDDYTHELSLRSRGMNPERLNNLSHKATTHYEYEGDIQEAERIVMDLIKDKSPTDKEIYMNELYRIFESGEHSIYQEIRMLLISKFGYSSDAAEKYILRIKKNERNHHIQNQYMKV